MQTHTRDRTNVRFYNSFFMRLIAAFILTLVVVTALQLLILSRGLQRVASEIDQAQYWDVASEIVQKLQARFASKFDEEEFRRELYYLSFLAPSFEAYLLDQQGQVRSYFPDSLHIANPKISLQPLQEALRSQSPELPLYGEDPKALQPVLFSVARLTVAGEPRFLYVVLSSSSREVLTRTTGQYFILESSLLAALIVTICSWFLSALFFMYFRKRFNRINNALAAYQRSDFSVRTPVTSADELGKLSETLNTMAAQIEKAQSELQQRDLQRRTLIADIVHDMRSPLTVLQTTLEKIADQSSPSLSDKYLAVLEDATSLQGSMVRDLFELSRLENPSLQLKFDDVSLTAIAKRLAERFRARAETQGVQIAVVTPAEPISTIFADESLLTRALNNLLENALRHTPAGGKITIRLVQCTHETLRLSVEDTGSGIAQNILSEVVERGVSDTQYPQGLGIGLHIVDQIVRQHNFTLHIDSSEGHGTTFCIDIELQKNLKLGQTLE